ncbi:hypothetical protein [Caldisalinibacter kiritimatiensis]|uniref:DUF3784 domain-containing protein n=1 Tax=Caldisalinibacter kiritimatiensis TaxID=1304284 RepID=R1CUA3_9FIRM|nr:hypothetical protein [Caldisalinibacter kiritimatiensis]EOD00259.1 hypothetical protein L21TH_1733 [Caldisalinibacter kiritimatiensis]
MLYIGVILIAMGLYTIVKDVINIEVFIKEREIKKRKKFKTDGFYEFKLAVGLFAIVVGVFSLINYFYI